MRPDPDTIIRDAMKLRTDRFEKRRRMLEQRQLERYNESSVDVPPAYRKTAHQHRSMVIEDEGRQIATLVYSMPVPHIPPPTPEDQDQTTTSEQFLMAFHEELEATYGPVWWQSTLEQTHNNISWDFLGWRKVPYKGQPKAPADDAGIADLVEYGVKNDRFKKDAGVRSYADYRHVPTLTAHPVGNIYDPDRFYEIKEVAERDLMETYDVVKRPDGTYTKAATDVTTTPSGFAANAHTATEARVTVVEYWDRDWCMIVVLENTTKWLRTRRIQSGYLLEEWEHGWGRVPYFSRPAFITEQLEEEHKYAGPLDGVYTEMPEHKRLRTMGSSIAAQTAFSPLQVLTKENGDLIIDDSNQKPITFLELKPGEARQMAPGQEIRTIPQSPEIANFYHEMQASQERIAHYSLSAVSKGVSPGADTANAALSNLHRFQLSTLDPMALSASRQASAMYRFVLERVQDMQERVFVFDEQSDSYLSLAASDIVSVNVQAKVTPDQGQFQLLIEKHVMELYLSPKPMITLAQAFEMMGKENPDQLVLEVKAEQLSDMLTPVINQQIVNDLGMMDAVKKMEMENAQSGDARNAVPGIMDRLRQMNPTGATGMGKGSPGAPRAEGVLSPTVSQTTQPQLTGGAP